MMTLWQRVIGMILVGGALLASGCSRSPRVNFYTLTATAPASAPGAARLEKSIAVGAVTLPEFVDRPQFVLVDGNNRVEILETYRWAESLKNAIPRVLADDLSRQLGTDRVSAYPQQAGSDADYQLTVDFQRFESTAEGVSLDALWTVRTADNQTITGRSRVREARTDSIDTLAPAFSRALAAVSADIAQRIGKELPR